MVGLDDSHFGLFPQHIWFGFKQQRKHQNGGKGVTTAGGKMPAVSDVPMIS